MAIETRYQEESFEEWCILELMGHRRMAGKLTETPIGGGVFLRIDIPDKDGKFTTQFYSPSAVYCITATTEQIARATAIKSQPEPVSRWELPAIEMPRFASCSYRDTCKKAITCQDCDVYKDAMQNAEQGSSAGEELEDEP